MTEPEKIIAMAEYEGWRKDEFSWFSPSKSKWSRWKPSGFDSVAIPDSKILPHYPTDLPAMELIFKKMAGKGWRITITFNNGVWICRLDKGSIYDTVELVHNESLSQAMFDCACKALGIDTNTIEKAR
jgi:hypothetical protein